MELDEDKRSDKIAAAACAGTGRVLVQQLDWE